MAAALAEHQFWKWMAGFIDRHRVEIGIPLSVKLPIYTFLGSTQLEAPCLIVCPTGTTEGHTGGTIIKCPGKIELIFVPTPDDAPASDDWEPDTALGYCGLIRAYLMTARDVMTTDIINSSQRFALKQFRCTGIEMGVDDAETRRSGVTMSFHAVVQECSPALA